MDTPTNEPETRIRCHRTRCILAEAEWCPIAAPETHVLTDLTNPLVTETELMPEFVPSVPV